MNPYLNNERLKRLRSYIECRDPRCSSIHCERGNMATEILVLRRALELCNESRTDKHLEVNPEYWIEKARLEQ